MTVDLELKWKSIPMNYKELTLANVLKSGQAFRWNYDSVDKIWSCSFDDRVIFLKQDELNLHYSDLFPNGNDDNENKTTKNKSTEQFIIDYFNLKLKNNVKLSELYESWSKIDDHFNEKIVNTVNKAKIRNYFGIRILRQDPWENLISFICSSNNNIKRISKMIGSLCENFGKFIIKFKNIDYFSFPSPKEILEKFDFKVINLINFLNDLKFGYRSKFIANTTDMIYNRNGNKNDENNASCLSDLYNLRNLSYEESLDYLLKLNGVGRKVADCVCLMSLDKHYTVPVDTHILNITKKYYLTNKHIKNEDNKHIKSVRLKLAGTNLNKSNYDKISKFYIDLWGEYAGWAQAVLFTANINMEDFENSAASVVPATVKKKFPGTKDTTSTTSTTGSRNTKNSKRRILLKNLQLPKKPKIETTADLVPLA
ncbi:8-oxoguanine glycosylase OGG1 [Ascoidea rubescens DSM 1968]|uniref:DNA-(apurinic or apyrimidinic site) lyase n=1 Tax=Ascoidea rubescens DSM 1968 TaxID=1344418 RepID=A0A1D2V9G6_9ASCO|nr:DNA glycosylase [Ascoidea rubescens DSM 1968]ODV58294.1 DNA glycosylase [Ascoidea rubescens DSM 1968]